MTDAHSAPSQKMANSSTTGHTCCRWFHVAYRPVNRTENFNCSKSIDSKQTHYYTRCQYHVCAFQLINMLGWLSECFFWTFPQPNTSPHSYKMKKKKKQQHNAPLNGKVGSLFICLFVFCLIVYLFFFVCLGTSCI